MISSLHGVLREKFENSVSIEVNGIGYFVNVSKLTNLNIGNIGDTIYILTELLIKDDKMIMYGFLNSDELRMFNLLQSLQGIGPKASLSILSALNVDDIILGIKSADKSIFLKAEGIGSKVANRIISELKDKIDKFFKFEDITKFKMPSDIKEHTSNKNINSTVQDALSALSNLGYTKSEAYKAVLEAEAELANKEEDINFKKLVPLALKYLQG